MGDNEQTYTPKDIMSILKLSKNTVYALLKSGAFPVHKIGKTYRIPKEGFDNWLNP